MSLSNVIKIARGELGVCESPPGSNRVKYWDIFGSGWQGQPWCVAFLAWVYRQAGEAAAFFGGALTASCGTLLRWYREQGLTVPVEQGQPGDIVILNFSGTQDTEHCGLVVEADKGEDGKLISVYTIEGNTSPGLEGSQDNGGCVAHKRRFYNQIVGVCRPQYQPEPVTVDDISGRWSEADIRWCIEHGLLKGYPDGSFKPSQPVTREELAVVIRRLVNM